MIGMSTIHSTARGPPRSVSVLARGPRAELHAGGDDGKSPDSLLFGRWPYRENGHGDCRGGARDRRQGRNQAGAGTRAAAARQGLTFQTRSGRADREHRRSHPLRCDHRRYGHTLWPHGIANGELSRSGRRTLGSGRVAWKGRGRLYLDRNPARGTRDHLVLDRHESAAFRDGYRWTGLWVYRSNDIE